MLSNNVPLLYVIMCIWWCHVFVPMEMHSRCCSQRRGSSVEGTCAGGGGVQRRDCRLGMFKHKGFGGEIYGNISGISWDIYIYTYQWVDDQSVNQTSQWNCFSPLNCQFWGISDCHDWLPDLFVCLPLQRIADPETHWHIQTKPTCLILFRRGMAPKE